MTNILIITNNKKVYIEFANKYPVKFCESCSQEDILKIARDCIHQGAHLVAHPMAGRIKPHETPYKSVVLEEGNGETHIDSVLIIEDSMSETRKELEHTLKKKYDEELLEDLQLLDFLLLQNVMDEYGR